MKRLYLAVVAAALALGFLPAVRIAGAQSVPRARSVARADSITVEEVIKLNQAGLSEDIIIQQIRKKGCAVDLSTDQLIALKNAHVSDRIVQLLLDPSAPDSVPAPPPSAAIVSRPDAEPARVVSRESVVREAALPSETGLYMKKNDQWVEMEPELVYWKTGGALKMMATAGVVHGDINGHVLGAVSHTSAPAQTQFLIVAPDGAAVSEYQLVHLHANRDYREFRTVTGGILHSQGGAMRDLVPFESEKLASRTYLVHFPSNQSTGEYGFLPPGSTGSSGKIYSFRLGD